MFIATAGNCRSIGLWALEQSVRYMPRLRLRQAELQKRNDLQPDEWGLSYDIGHTMDEVLSLSNWGSAYVCLPGCRIPEAEDATSCAGSIGSAAGQLSPAKRKRGRPKMLDWYFRNGQLPKVGRVVLRFDGSRSGQHPTTTPLLAQLPAVNLPLLHPACRFCLKQW